MSRLTSEGYLEEYVVGRGYVATHRKRMEDHLGRHLGYDEIVHHINGDKLDNSIENLEVMSRVEHGRHHAASPRVLDMVCDHCGTSFRRRGNQRPENKGYSRCYCSRACVYADRRAA